MDGAGTSPQAAAAAARQRATAGWGWGAAVAVTAAYAGLWAAGLAHFHQAPPLDSAEQLVWSYALEGGYWKHPPLPSWIMHGLVRLFGPSVALPFFAAQLSVAIALLLLWRLGCEIMGPRRSFAAAALTALVGYHGWAADTFNHNAALLPFQAGVTLWGYLALRRGRWHLWAAAGLCAGLALLVKYVALLPLAGLVLYVLLDRRTHTLRTAAGMLLAALVAAVVVAPHALWLRSHDASPLRYARAVATPLADAGAWAANLGAFTFAQLLQLAPLLLVLAWMALSRRRGAGVPAAPAAPEDRLFLWTVGVAPLALVVLSGLVRGTEILPRWGYNGFLLVGWLVLDALRWPERRIRPLLHVAVALQAVLWIACVVMAPRVAAALQWQGRFNFPGADLAAAAESTWRSHTGQPLRLVVSDIWLGGTLAAYHGAPLAVLADGELARAPWVSARDLAACGALVVQDRTEPFEDPVPGVSRYLESAPLRGEWILDWSASRGLRHHRAGMTRIAWGILPPSGSGRCAL